MVTWRFWPENTTAQNCHITLPLRSPPLQGSVWGLETLSATIGFLSLFWWAEDVNLRWASSLFEHRQIWSALSRGLCCRSHQTLINPWSMFSDDFRSLKVRLPWFHLLRHSMGQSLIRGISTKKKIIPFLGSSMQSIINAFYYECRKWVLECDMMDNDRVRRMLCHFFS